MPVLLSTPLLKVPLLIGNAVFTYYGMTPPRQPPPAKEQLKFAVPDLMTRTTHLQLAATAVSKVRTSSSTHYRIVPLLPLFMKYVL